MAAFGASALGGTVALLPVLNEAGTVGAVIEGVLSSGSIEHLLVVDDASSDGTQDELEKAKRRWPQMEVTIRRDQKGLGSALLFGFREVVQRYPFDRLLVLDGDLSHDPASIPHLLSVPADLVVGSRYTPGGRIENWNAIRRLISLSANSLARRLLALPVQDITSGFRVYSRSLVGMILSNAACGGYEFQVETIWLAAAHRYSIAEVPIAFIERKVGESKLATPEEALKFARFVVTKTFFSWRNGDKGGQRLRGGRTS
jgi:dolichol-phosphate mannosyltransferase